MTLAALNTGTLFTGLLLAAMALAAVVGGIAAQALRIPRVIGYLLAGAFVHLAAVAVVSANAAGGDAPESIPFAPGSIQHARELLKQVEHPLKIVKSLALGLILFSIGGVFDARWMRGAGRQLWRFSLLDAALTGGLVGVAVLVAATMGTTPVGAPILPLALLLGMAAIATAPAATLVTLREYDAKGPVTDMTLGVVGVSNVACIILFDLVFLGLASAGALGATDVNWKLALLGVLLTTVGSLVVGVGLALILSIAHSRLQPAETLLLAIAVLIGLWSGRGLLIEHFGVSFNFLLTALIAGAVFANVAVDPARFESAIAGTARPLFVVFFAMAGYQMRFDEVAHLGAIGVAYVTARGLGKWLAVRLAWRWAGSPAELRPDLGKGLMCQAAVLIGLADFVHAHWNDEWGSRTFVTTALGSVIVFELCGPILLKRLVVAAGEVKAITLLRGGGHGGVGADVARAIGSLIRTIGVGRGAGATNEPLRVRHIMRSNVKSLRADATFDEVLRFVEQSRFSQFPVVDEGDRLIGVIHFSDIREIIYDATLARLVTAADLCNASRPVAPIEMPLDEALRAFQKNDGNAMTVVDDTDSRRVLGIVEQRDLLRAMRH
ncbi:MAG: CBS domain-containing protein [Phycisphaerales bacterium]|nr:CBS domain-containing protein [Phycisphaerales bacterium]